MHPPPSWDARATTGTLAAAEATPHGQLQGWQQLSQLFDAWAGSADFLSFEPHDYAAAGGQVFKQLANIMRIKATGRTVRNFSLRHLTVRHGKFGRGHGHDDTAPIRDGQRRPG